MIGRRLGPYEVTGKLGEGGMGVVFRAKDSQLGREVAIKVLPQGLTSDPERAARFECGGPGQPQPPDESCSRGPRGRGRNRTCLRPHSPTAAAS
jgi:serine/threonine protein kinase